MSRVPQPSYPEHAVVAAGWRPAILPADYSDEVSDLELEALRRISAEEIDLNEFELVDGPAW